MDQTNAQKVVNLVLQYIYQEKKTHKTLFAKDTLMLCHLESLTTTANHNQFTDKYCVALFLSKKKKKLLKIMHTCYAFIMKV